MKKFKHVPPKEIICPHCFESFPLWDIRFQDNTSTLYAPYRPLFARLRRLAPKFAIGQDGKYLRDKVCPLCKKPLPWTAGEQEDLIIGLMGTKFSGKSHFVATLLDRLEGPVSTSFNAALLQIDDLTALRRRQEFQGPLRNRRELRVTPLDVPPLLYNFTIGGYNERNGSRSVTLALCDTAGDNFNTQQDVIEKTKYLSCAAGLLFLIDPLQTKTVRQSLPHTVKMPPDPESIESNPNELLARVIQALQLQGAVHNNRSSRLTIPVAIVLTKCDILRDAGLIDPRCLWNQDLYHEGVYDLSLHNDVNGTFSELVKAWSEPTWASIQRHFANVAFFGLTATGCASDEQGHYAKIAPWRVEDPLLWLLFQLGVISGSNA